MSLLRNGVLPALLLGFATHSLAQSDSAELDSLSLEDCALIEQSVKRLACYDAKVNPDEAQETAGEDAVEATEKATEGLGIDREGRITVLSEEEREEADGNSGVMSTLIDRYAATERALFSYSGSFVSHRPTYILPVSYVHDTNQTPSSPRLGETEYGEKLDNHEAKYQISFKVPLLTGVLDERTTFWFGYTQLSFWQVYDTENSAPFRETNYEPELFLRYQAGWKLGPGQFDFISLGINHQSNGRSEPQSRSWNRIMGNITYSYDRWLFVVSPWYRLPESRSEDDNADIERYLGHANYRAIYKWSEDRTLSLKLRNNLRTSDNKTSIQLGYSFPMGDQLKGFVQYYNGYGESLIDYNERIHRLGIGVMLNDWL